MERGCDYQRDLDLIRFRYSTWLLLLLLPAWGRPASAAEVIPPSPAPHYIVDRAGVLSSAALADLDRQLEEFERATTNQLVVALYPKMQSADDIAAYAVRVAQAWQIGQKKKDNGLLLLVFVQDHKLTIQVGYGLEGALPDATAKMIIEEEIKPHFKAGDYDGGIRAGVQAIIAATKYEYKGRGQVHGESTNPTGFTICMCSFFALMFFLIIVGNIAGMFRGTLYTARRRSFWWNLLWILSTFSTNRGGSSGGGGWSGGSSGGGFSGGGGSFGGGGASGSW